MIGLDNLCGVSQVLNATSMVKSTICQIKKGIWVLIFEYFEILKKIIFTMHNFKWSIKQLLFVIPNIATS